MSADTSATQMLPTVAHRDPEAFCRCGHYENEHSAATSRCSAVLPDRCSCHGFRYGSRSEHAR